VEKEYSEKLSQFEESQNNLQLEIHKIEEKLKGLQKERVKFEEIVSKDNSNIPALQKLNDVDLEIENEKRHFNEISKELLQAQLKMRKVRLKFETNVIDTLKDELKKLKNEKEKLRSDLIPVASQVLKELEERKAQIESQIVILSNKISELETNFEG